MILHLRVAPGFGLAVEARARPELHSVPAIMGGSSRAHSASPRDGRGAVREANFPAQARGVEAGMMLSQAYQHCPDGRFLTPDDALYAAVWDELCAILRRYTPSVEPIERGQAALDLSGCPGAADDHAAARLAGEIAQAVRAGTGIVPWFGLATNRLVAELASDLNRRAGGWGRCTGGWGRDPGDGGITIIPPGRERTFLADLPLTALPEVDARLALTFQVLGLRTMGQFAVLPRSAVRQRFGTLGERLHAWSRGIDPRRVVPPPEEPAVRARAECEEGTPEDALATLHRLAEECAAELQRRNLAGTLITLTLFWSEDGEPPARTRELPAELSVELSVALPLSGQDSAAAEQNGGKETNSLSTRCAALRRGLGHRGPRLRQEGRQGRRLQNKDSRAPIPTAEQAFPIAYRIHSMLPQPGNPKGGPEYKPVAAPATQAETSAELPAADPPAAGTETAALPLTTLTTLVRTPISDLPPLFERARDLLLRHSLKPAGTRGRAASRWPRDQERPVRFIELAVSSFEQPVQLAFVELNRLEGIGVLRGMDAARRRAFEQAEEALATRYGDTSFRRLAHLDPANILTERRFRWDRGVRSQVSGVRASPLSHKSDP
jgi:DNA polymerase-4